MGEKSPDFGSAFGRRFAFPSFLLVFGLFCANVLAGKLFILAGWNRAWLADDLIEFLLLALSAILLMLAALSREAAEGRTITPSHDQREQDNEENR